MPKFLLIFEKNEPVRWLGHLDILRTFERSIRRAGLPIAFSAGFNPRERLYFASALSTGITGSAEPMVLELTEPMTPLEITRLLNDSLPPGIRIKCCSEIPDAGSKDLLNTYCRAEYNVLVDAPDKPNPAEVKMAISETLLLEEIPWIRAREGRSKTVDLKPYIFELELTGDRNVDSRFTVRMIVAIGESGSAKPSEVIAFLGTKIPNIKLRRAHRIQLLKNAIVETIELTGAPADNAADSVDI